MHSCRSIPLLRIPREVCVIPWPATRSQSCDCLTFFSPGDTVSAAQGTSRNNAGLATAIPNYMHSTLSRCRRLQHAALVHASLLRVLTIFFSCILEVSDRQRFSRRPVLQEQPLASRANTKAYYRPQGSPVGVRSWKYIAVIHMGKTIRPTGDSDDDFTFCSTV